MILEWSRRSLPVPCVSFLLVLRISSLDLTRRFVMPCQCGIRQGVIGGIHILPTRIPRWRYNTRARLTFHVGSRCAWSVANFFGFHHSHSAAGSPKLFQIPYSNRSRGQPMHHAFLQISTVTLCSRQSPPTCIGESPHRPTPCRYWDVLGADLLHVTIATAHGRQWKCVSQTGNWVFL